MANFVKVNTDYGESLVNLDTITCISKDGTNNNTILSFSGLREDLIVLENYDDFLYCIKEKLRIK